jgi:nucleotide-binding universal stress UspA family protein
MKILVAVDCSEFSIAAVQAVLRQFRPENVELFLLHVVDPKAYVPLYEGAAPDAKRAETLLGTNCNQAEELINRETNLLTDCGYRVTTSIGEGEPRSAIVAYAREIKADMIVVGSRGPRGLLLGSVSEYILSHAPCTVEIVRPLPTAA